MDIATIEEAVQAVVNDLSRETFIYRLLAAYGKPKASITRLQKGNLNLSKHPGEVIWKKNVLFHALDDQHKHSTKNPLPAMVREGSSASWDLHVVVDRLRKSEDISKHALRFVITTDWETLLAVDTKTAETLDIPIRDLPKHAHFFLPWAGQEKHKSHNESQADINAAYKMGKLYDQICKDNPGMSPAESHALNVFLSRLLFCFFAEDTEIFPTEGMFTSSIASHTQDDGSDLNKYLDRLFETMNTEDNSKSPAYLQAFPYVNGGLFSDKLKAPTFSRLSRKLILECGDLDWSEINPDIFGSMMQAVVQERGSMHYTSVSNIMKVIEPLFLKELRLAFEENLDNPKALERLRTRLSNIKIFDPACGSGNFLIIAFKELRKLEMEIYLRLRELNPNYQTLFTLPQIQLTQFYGIELEDFAHEIAVLSLWLAEHQMNVKFKQNLGIVVPPLPLKPSGHIICANATRKDWASVCPITDSSEVYVLGNPPYVGSSNQDETQKSDLAFVFSGLDNYKNLDYVACWFLRGADYIQSNNAKLGFVCTSSICEGEQVEMLWPHLFGRDLEISFAHQAFHWSNNAKHNAGITCAIVGLRNNAPGEKPLFSEKRVRMVPNIGPYLIPSNNTVVRKRSKVLSQLPEMTYGSKPVDEGHLYLTDEQRAKVLTAHPHAAKFTKKILGSKEFINGLNRWCIWVEPDDVAEAESIPLFNERFKLIEKFRRKSVKEATNDLASVPYRFGEPRYVEGNSLIVPSVSSENREYVPIGFLDPDTVISNLAFAVYEPKPWVFAVLCSKMHNMWVRTVGGRMRKDIRYSNQLCYNTFPFPALTEKQQDGLTGHVFNVLAEREKHPEKTMAQLYDVETMPAELLEAHRDLDIAVDRLYRSRPFGSDEERLDFLFPLYEEMIQQERSAAGAKV